MILEFLELLVEVVGHWLFGWAYIFSPRYRKKARRRWQLRSPLENSLEVMIGVLGVLGSLIVAGVILRSVLPRTMPEPSRIELAHAAAGHRTS